MMKKLTVLLLALALVSASAFGADLNVRVFGVRCDGVTDDATALNNMLANAAQTGDAIIFPNAVCKVASGITTTKALRFIGAGQGTLLRGTNAAGQHTLHIDGTAAGSNKLQGVAVQNMSISSEAGGGDALRLTNVGRSCCIGPVWIPSAAGAGIRSIASHYVTYVDPVVSTNVAYSAGTRAIPAYGISLEDDGSSNASGHNTIVTPTLEGLTGSPGTAINVAGNASHNVIIGGDGAGGNIGLVIGASALLNHVNGTVFESNNTRDVDISGQMNMLTDVQVLSSAGGGTAGTTTVYSGAVANHIIGGRHRFVTINAGAVGTHVLGVATLGTDVTDNGTKTQIRSAWDVTNSQYNADRLVLPSAASNTLNGMVALKDQADKNRVLAYGIDNTLGTNGVAWLQAVRNGSNYMPYQLNPNGGTLETGNAVVEKQVAVAYSAAMSPLSPDGNWFVITPTNGVAFTINQPSVDARQLRTAGQRVTFTIKNTTGGALGAATWANGTPGFRLGAAWVQPATGFSRSIEFRSDGTLWVEVGRTAADVAN